MEQVEKKSGHKMAPTELQLRYLYLLTLVNEKADHNVDFILQRMALCRRELTMYGKALSAICLDYFKQKAESELTLQSLMEYTVASPEKGRWFNTPRAEWSWNAYRIPTQCAAIEALTHFDREADAHALRLWLLQAKRTQMWETSRATADAVYALLMSANAAGSPVQTQKNVPVGFALKKAGKWWLRRLRPRYRHRIRWVTLSTPLLTPLLWQAAAFSSTNRRADCRGAACMPPLPCPKRK